jgi:chemotaxis family two-component system response regulator Rcp1
VFLIQRALESTRLPLTFHVLRNGDEAVRFFDQADRDAGRPCPDVVILDINLPKRTGTDVLKQMRASCRCSRAQVIAVSTSDSPHDREQMARLGADGYFRKPSGFDEFMKLGDLIKNILGPGPSSAN